MDADPSNSSPDANEAPAIPVVLDGEIIVPRSEQAGDSRSAPPPGWTPSAAPPFRLRLSTALAAFACVAILSSAIAGGSYAAIAQFAGTGDRANPTTAALARLQQDVATLKAGVDTLKSGAELAREDEAVRSLKKSVDVLKAEIDSGRGTNAAALAQLNAKLDKPDHDPSPKLTEITARLDRIEKQVSSPTPTGSIAAPVRSTPPQTSSAQAISAPSADKPLPRPAVLDSWIVRDVYDGIALVEGRGGGVREVTPGEFLPGAGEVRSIERRGRAWIVVTSRGIIDNATW